MSTDPLWSGIGWFGHLLADFVDRVLGGDSRPWAARIIEIGGLTPEQVRALEEIIASGTRRK